MSKQLLAGILDIGAVIVGNIVAGPIGGIVAGVLVSTTTSLLLGPSAPKPEQSETAIKSPTPVRVSAYGASRLAIAYALYETGNAGVGIDVGAIHDGRIDGPITFYLGDTPVARDRGVLPGTTDGAFSQGQVEIDFRHGASTEAAYSQVVALLPDIWSSDHRGDGVCTGMVTWQPTKQSDYLKVYPNGQPALSLAARWQPVFDWRDPTQSLADPLTWKWSENAVLHTVHYLLVRDNKDWTTHFAPSLTYWTHAANVADEPVSITGGQAATAFDDAVDSDHSLVLGNTDGLAAGMSITITANDASGHVETIPVQSVSGTTVMLAQEVTYFYPKGSLVTWSGAGSTEPRYRGCVAHKHSDAHKDVLASLIACFDGWLQPRSDGALVVYAGEYVAPDPADLIGPDCIVSYSIQDGVDEENAINQITLTYVSSSHDYATVDTDPWEDTEDQAARGKVLATQLSNQVPSFSQARRLGKASMARTMAPKRGTVTVNSRGRPIRGKRYVRLLIVEAGTTFLDAVVEVTKLTRNMQTFGYTAEWVLADPNAYAWDAATEEGSAAPIGNRVAPEPLAVPTLVSVTPTYGQDAAFDTPGVRLTLVVQGPNRADLTWYVRTRPVGGVSWAQQEFPDENAGSSVTLQTDFVPLATLEAEVAYRTGDGRLSPWGAPASPVNAGGSVPGAVTGLSVSANGDGSLIYVDWDDAAFATSYQVEVIVEAS